MSTVVDERVVEMQFDNRDFERNVQTSMSTLGKLKQSLNLTGAAKGLTEINTAAKSISLDSIASGVSALERRFSTMGIVGMQVINRITDSIINLSNKTLAFLTNGVVNGGINRAMNLENAHFQLQGLLKDEKEVSAVMKNVNDSVDGTAYSLDAAATVASQLAASGMRAGDQMFSSLRAVAGVAAMTNSAYEDIGRIFTQIAGQGRLMGNDLLQLSGRGMNAAATIAEYLGKTEGEIREMVSDGKISFETFANAMDSAFGEHAKKANETFNGAMSNVKAALARIGAEFVSPLIEQKGPLVKLFNVLRERVNDVKKQIGPLANMFTGWVTKIANSATGFFSKLDVTNYVTSFINIVKGIISIAKPIKEAFTEMFPPITAQKIADFSKGLKDLTAKMELNNNQSNKLKTAFKGLFDIVGSLVNVLKGIISVAKPIKEAFTEIFPPITVQKFADFAKGLRDLTAKMKLNYDQSTKLKSAFKGLFSAIDICIIFIKQVVLGIAKLLSNFKKLGSGILNIASSFGDWVTNLRNSIKETDIFGRAINKVTDFVQKAIDKIKELIGFLKEKIKMPGFEWFFEMMKNIWGFLQKIGGKISEIGSNIGKTLLKAFRNGDINAGLDIINGGLFATLLTNAKKFIGALTNRVENAKGLVKDVKGITDNIKSVLNEAREAFKAWQEDLKANILLKLAGAIGILAVSLLLIATIDPDRLNSALVGVAGLFIDLVTAMAAFNKIGGESKKALSNITVMIGMATAITILASALKKLSDVSWEGLAKGITGISALMLAVGLFVKSLSTSESTFSLTKNGIFSAKSKKSMISAGLSMIAIGTSMKIFASAMRDFASLDWEGIGKGAAAIADILVAVAIFDRVAGKAKKLLTAATSLVIVSASMKIFASAMRDFANLSWEGVAKGLASMGALLLAVGLFNKALSGAKSTFALTKNGIFSAKSQKNMMSAGLAMIAISSSMKIFASAMRDFANLSWEDIGKGAVAIVGILSAVAIFDRVAGKAKKLMATATSLVIVGASMKIFASAMQDIAALDWGGVAKGLVSICVLLTAIAAFSKVLGGSKSLFSVNKNGLFSSKTSNNMLSTGAALILVSASLKVFASVMQDIATLSWEDVAKGLVTIAGLFTIIGVAGLVLKPLAPTILLLSAAIALLGAACVSVGIGMSLLSAGLVALTTAVSAGATEIVAALVLIIDGVAGCIPVVMEELGKGIVAFCVAIGDSAIAIGEAVKAIVLTIIDVLAECIPPLVDVVLKLIAEFLCSLVKYTPQIIDSIMQFIVELFEGLARNLPSLIQSIVDLIMSLFSGVVDALKKIDPDTFIKGLLSVGLMAAIMYALSALASLTPHAMLGVLGLGAVMTELAIVLAAIGELSKIQGLNWLINEGGQLMQNIGNAIGGFIGGIVGGVMEGVSASLPQIGSDLSDFMDNIQTFIDGAKKIDSSMLEGVNTLVDVIFALTAANVFDTLTWFITGGSSLTKFAKQLVPFGEAMSDFSSKVSGNIDGAAVTAAANAGKVMAEMASALPNSGGVAGFFAGENDIDMFGTKLVSFGESITKFSKTVSGNIDQDAVTAAANAGKTMLEFQNTLPDTDGVMQFFSGQQNMDTFGEKLVSFGESIAKFSSTVCGKVDENSVSVAANAGKIMAEFQSSLPNTGGVVQFFTGQQNMDTFGEKLVSFGESITEFSSTVCGNINEGAITAAANAGKTMLEFQSTLPNTGGVVQFFTGQQDMGLFGSQLASFGESIAKFSDSVSGKVDEDAVVVAANAGKVMSELQSTLPNTGGLIQFITGQQNLGTFGVQLALFGAGIAKFSESISGKIDPVAIGIAACAGKLMAELQATLPNTGGLIQFITGQQNLGTFGSQLSLLGKGIANFSSEVSGKIDPVSVSVAASACKTLGEMTQYLPNQGGIAAWFGGEKSLSSLSDGMGKLGTGIKDFSDNVAGIVAGNVTVGADAAKTLAQMTQYLPNKGGIAAWFGGEKSVSNFAYGLGNLGTGIANFARNIGETKLDNVSAGADVAKSLSEMTQYLPNQGGIGAWFGGEKSVSKFSEDLGALGTGISKFATNLGVINPEVVTAGVDAAKGLAEMTQCLPNQGGIGSWFGGEKSVSAFSEELGALGTGISSFATNLGVINPEAVTAGVDAAKDLAEMTNTAPDDSSKLTSLGENLETFGSSLSSYFEDIGDVTKETITAASSIVSSVKEIQTIDSDKVSSASDAMDKMVQMLKGMSEIKGDASSGFTKSLSNLGETSVDSFVEAFNGIITKMKDAGKKAVDAFINAVTDAYDRFSRVGNTAASEFIDGVNKKKDDTLKTFANIISSCVSAIEDKKSSFETAGNNLGEGLIIGINARQQEVYNAGYALGQKAVQGEKDGQKSSSPSKLTIRAGKWLGEGLIIGIAKMGSKAYKAGHDLGDTAVHSISSAISKVSDLIDSDIDSEPTIRPVLDLSDIESGAGAINNMLGFSTPIGVMTNLGSINSMMDRYNQNGPNNDVISAIKDLGRKIGNIGGDTYNVNGITYDDGSNVSDAVKTLVRAARIERRS